MGRGRAWPASASQWRARAAQIRAQPGRHRRSRRRAAVLVRVRAAGRPALRAGVPHRALLQDRALFAGHALAARCALSRAPRAVRLRGDHHGQRAGGRRLDASGRGQGAAGQARHHSRRLVVGDRHRRHHRLWRRSAGHRARQADRHRHHLHWRNHDGAAGRHHRHRLRRANPPPRFYRHLGHDRARAAVRRARRRCDLRHHATAARAGGGGRRDHRARRRSRAFDVFHRRRRGGGGAQKGNAAARRRPFLRRGGGAAPRPPLGHRHRAHAHEFAGALGAGSARADAARLAHRRTHQGRGGKTRRPRCGFAQGRYRDGGD